MLLRVDIALLPKSLRQSLCLSFDSSNVILTEISSKRALWTRLREQPADIYLLPSQWVENPDSDVMQALIRLAAAPWVLVFSEVEDPNFRLHMLSSGCKAVLNSTTSIDVLVNMLEDVFRQRRMELTETTQVQFAEPRLSDFVSNSPRMQEFMQVARRMIAGDSTLLITGETGVGKERLARAIHAESSRGQEAFIAINCAALPDQLLESELFGHERGAFTGASQARRGAFELAHRGTIFLDEIGDMPLSLQSKLLRVLQEREFLRVGGEVPVRVDVRLMAATNRNLPEMVRADDFRRDLYYRLSVVTLEIPPLRERREDIEELVLNYIAYLRPRIGVRTNDIDSEALAALCGYDWPGNVRELINVIERALLLGNETCVRTEDLPEEIVSVGAGEKTEGAGIVVGGIELPEDWECLPWREVRASVLDELEARYIQACLRRSHGRVGDAANLAGMTPRSLHSKMKAFGIRKEDYRL